MLPYYDLWAWPLRTALACAIASLIYLSPVDQQAQGLIEARILGPVVSIMCSSILLGQTLRTCWFSMRGAVLGGAIGTALVNILWALGWTMPVVIYAIIGIVSIIILWYPMSALQQKIAWALVTVGAATLLQQGRALDRL